MDLLLELDFLRDWNRIIRDDLMCNGCMSIALGPVYGEHIRERIEESSDIRIVKTRIDYITRKTILDLELNTL